MVKGQLNFTKRYMCFLTLLLLSSTLLLAQAKQVSAQADLSLGMASTSQVLQLEPTEKYTGEIILWNQANKTTKYDIKITGFKQIENRPGTAIMLSDQEESKSLYSASSWITTNKDFIELVPNRNEKVLFEVTVPENVTDGEYNALISFVSEQEENKQTTATFATLSSGIPILIKVGDEFIENAELLDFSTEQKYYEKPVITFNTKINNIGDTHIAATGDIVLTNIFNQEIVRIPFNPNGQSILRDNIGDYSTIWEGSLLTKENKLVIGPIKANLTVTYREFQPGFAPLLAETSFWVIPWKYILLLLLGVILIVVLLKIRKFKKKNRAPFPV